MLLLEGLDELCSGWKNCNSLGTTCEDSKVGVGPRDWATHLLKISNYGTLIGFEVSGTR